MQANGHPEALSWRWIDRDEELDEIMPSLLEAEILALDTESNNYNAYNAQLCLLQVATPSALFVLDTLALSTGALQVLAPLLEDPYTTKIIHGADNDLAYLYNELGIQLHGLFDTILAARFLNLPKRGLGDLLDRYFQVKSSKQYQRFDWSIRPLPDKALHYAVQDVRYTIPLYHNMCEDLDAVDRMDAVVEESEAITARDFTPKPFDPHGYRRIKGAKGLNEQQTNVLYALYMWRHNICTKLNRAAFMVIDNAALLSLASRQPTSMQQLKRTPQVSSNHTHRFGRELLETIAKGQSQRAPIYKRKTPAPDRRSRKEKDLQTERLERLREWRNQTAEELQFESDLVALNTTLQHLSFHPPHQLEDLAQVPGMLPWRLKRFAKPLLKLLQT